MLVSVFEDDVGWTQDIVHAHNYVLGNRHQWLRGIDMYSFRSNYIFFVRNWCHVFTEGQDQLNCHISFTWMQIGIGMGVHCHWYDSSLLLTPNKSIETFDILELDDISYECARENVSKNLGKKQHGVTHSPWESHSRRKYLVYFGKKSWIEVR